MDNWQHVSESAVAKVESQQNAEEVSKKAEKSMNDKKMCKRNNEERVNQLAVITNTNVAATYKETNSDLKSLQCCDKSTSASFSEFVARHEQPNVNEFSNKQTSAISSSSAFEVNGSVVSVFNELPYGLPLATLASSSPPPSYFGSTECISFAATTPSLTSSSTDDSCSNTLTPNKCLAELERLYAEFRESESAFEQRYNNNNNIKNKHQQESVNLKVNQNQNHTFSASPTLNRAESNNKSVTMRLSIPATTTTATSSTDTSNTLTTISSSTTLHVGDTDANAGPYKTSNVILSSNTKPTSLTDNINNSCNNLTTTTSTGGNQRHPSLTIQVNNHNNNNNNINYDNGKSDNVNVNQQDQVCNNNNENNNNNNCVSVVNCAYVSAEDKMNSNNNANSSFHHDNNGNSIFIQNHQNCVSDNNNVSIVPLNAVNAITTTTATTTNNNNNNASNSESIVWHSVPQNINETSDIVNVININNNNNNNASLSTSCMPRTFTSTECQTDDVTSMQQIQSTSQYNREQRRRDRRERRQQRDQDLGDMVHRRLSARHSMPPTAANIMSLPTANTTATMPAGMSALLRPILPDILHNHFPPPYSALAINTNGLHAAAPTSLIGTTVPPTPPTLLTPVISTVPLHTIVNDGRFTLPLPIMRR